MSNHGRKSCLEITCGADGQHLQALFESVGRSQNVKYVRLVARMVRIREQFDRVDRRQVAGLFVAEERGLIEEFHGRLRDSPHTWLEWSCSQLLQNTDSLKATILLLQIDGLILAAPIELRPPYFVHSLMLGPTVVNRRAKPQIQVAQLLQCVNQLLGV